MDGIPLTKKYTESTAESAEQDALHVPQNVRIKVKQKLKSTTLTLVLGFFFSAREQNFERRKEAEKGSLVFYNRLFKKAIYL